MKTYRKYWLIFSLSALYIVNVAILIYSLADLPSVEYLPDAKPPPRKKRVGRKRKNRRSLGERR